MTTSSVPAHERSLDSGPLASIRERRPLIHLIANLVSMAACAQAVNSLGAASLFAHVPEEAVEVALSADAVVINIGTSVPGFGDTAVAVAVACAGAGIPVVLDPLGAGASSYRAGLVRRLVETGAITLVSGNAAELAALAGIGARSRGADSLSTALPPEEVAARAAARTGAVVSMSGRVDRVSDGTRTAGITGGHPVMGRVVGTGSVRTSVLGAFLSVGADDPFAAALAGTRAFSLAGERAAAAGGGPGHFFAELYNVLDTFDDADIAAAGKGIES
ncbi:hydroxyethylthiazole kinase [Streptomyces sp. NBC_01217]|uniref:hydroxyethylthiazole kinase n=1 Tax=Streptomyces sp. NBC_01217 TaxID=2903779 RepID=UPI002E0E412F|nr:hydroxyethylthiazole kinase [Streptomyces sp. NBC_01217]